MAEATYCLSPCDAGGNEDHPPSLDFRRRRALDWDDIEVELHISSVRVQAIEMLGRTGLRAGRR